MEAAGVQTCKKYTGGHKDRDKVVWTTVWCGAVRSGWQQHPQWWRAGAERARSRHQAARPHEILIRIVVRIAQDGVQMWGRCIQYTGRTSKPAARFRQPESKENLEKALVWENDMGPWHRKHRVLQPPHLKRPWDIPRPLLMSYKQPLSRVWNSKECSAMKCMARPG